LRYVLGISFYIMVGWVLHYAYNNYAMSKVNVVWSCVSIITAIILGYLVYDEGIDFLKVIGLLLALSAIWCVM
jgi:multidrug transporter EmrE-like cation transporter